MIFCAAAILVTASRHPDRLGALLVGMIFVVSLATTLGTVSGNSKAFIVVFLSFWYLVINDKGQTRILDFAGLYGRSTNQTMLIYLALSVGAIFLANIAYRTVSHARRGGFDPTLVTRSAPCADFAAVLLMPCIPYRFSLRSSLTARTATGNCAACNT